MTLPATWATRTTGLGTQNLVHDVQNRLQTITGTGADLTSLYDADGVRVKRTLDSDDTFYLADAYDITSPSSGSDTISVHVQLAGQAVGSSIDGVFHVTGTDHLGSGSVSRDEAGSTTI